MEKTILFGKVNPKAIIPSKREEDAGMDIYACIDTCRVIRPQQIAMIPTGLISAFAHKWRIVLRERGSSSSKGLAVRCGVIDSGFRGEWFIAINNTSDRTIVLTNTPEKYEQIDGAWIIYDTKKAICQALVEEVPQMEVRESSPEEILSYKSERGAGMLGSSNK